MKYFKKFKIIKILKIFKNFLTKMFNYHNGLIQNLNMMNQSFNMMISMNNNKKNYFIN